MDLKGKVDVPGVGGVDKRVLIGIGGAAAVFLGWQYYRSRSAADYDPEAEPVDPGMEDPGILPAVEGAVRPDNDYGLPDGSADAGTGSYGFTGTKDSQWTQYVAAQLVASESWSYTAIITALGKYLNSRPLDSKQIEIVQAGLAVAGPPPEHPGQPIVPGGETKVTVAPTGLRVVSTTSTTVTLAWNKVAGADSYRVYRSGASTNVGSTDGGNTTITISGLQPNTDYKWQVAADSIGDVPGPKSTAVSGKTKTVALKAPTGVRVSSIAATAATVSWSGVPSATSYRIYANGNLRGTADGGLRNYRITGLSKKTKYTIQVAADTTNQPPGPMSSKVVFTTKSK